MKLFSKNNLGRIYMDFASATPILPEIEKEINKFSSKEFYNPAAIYKEGKLLREKLDLYRKKIGAILQVNPSNIVFTSGGTESNNLALLGIFEAFKEKISKPHFIISSIEHSAIIETAKEIERRGGEITIIGVDAEGQIFVDELKDSLKENTVLVSIMLANNEIGVIEPIGKFSRIVKEFRKKNLTPYPYIHSDASQGGNYLNLNIESLGLDLMTLDGSKIYGPKSSGLLIIKTGVKIHPIIFGGGQEGNLRSGTENPSQIIGMSMALEIAQRDREKESKRLNTLKNLFIQDIKKQLPRVLINTPLENSLPNIVNLSFPKALGEFIAIKLDLVGILVSTGSSCGIYKDKGGSSTIEAIGKKDLAESSVRFSFGRTTTKEDINKAVDALKKILFS